MKFLEYEIKKSKFYSVCLPINSKEEVKAINAELWKKFKKATHICYGYSFLNEGIINAGFDDDGEPKGTAGKPIRDLLIKTSTQNIAIFVVRYFGGIKLGAGGLGKAYTKSASQALNDFKKENVSW
ncbi:YigZ family protein [Mycoplasma sp. HS2188]|uniref:IMPACT family protein n=1 Tax=Mycoplasma sp. HS2188 TaxID=2976765 RepID=UPI0021AA2A6E|nr:YigZ family protein [Mycoplasma sp. HS2188]MCT4469807.1 YigZ family protein [Mycoplasma sp. HS2188]